MELQRLRGHVSRDFFFYKLVKITRALFCLAGAAPVMPERRRRSESVEGKKEKEYSFINKQLSRDTSMTQLEKAGLAFLALVAIISLVFES